MEFMYKFFYKFPESWEREYKKRVHSPNAKVLDLSIKPKKSNENYKLYFIPTLSIMSLVVQIEKCNALLRELSFPLPIGAKESLQDEMVVNELYFSNQIENVKSTKKEIAKSMKVMKENNQKSPRFESMLKAYMKILYSTNKLPRNAKDVRTIYDEITAGEISEMNKIEGSLFREEAVKVMSSTNRVLHEGIMPHNLIVEKVEELLNFLNNQDDIEPIIKIAIAHYYFGYIHPFYDGNGRTSRFISSLYLNETYDQLTAISLSRGIESNNKVYYDIFDKTNSAMNKGELNYFIEHFLAFIKDGQELLIEELKAKKTQLDYAINIINKDQNLSQTHKDTVFIMAQFYYYSIEEHITVQQIESYLNLTDKTIRKILNDLLDLGYIEKVGKRPILYKLSEAYF